MTVYAFILTYLIGGFTITPMFIYVFFKYIDNENKKDAMDRHPSTVSMFAQRIDDL